MKSTAIPPLDKEDVWRRNINCLEPSPMQQLLHLVSVFEGQVSFDDLDHFSPDTKLAIHGFLLYHNERKHMVFQTDFSLHGREKEYASVMKRLFVHAKNGHVLRRDEITIACSQWFSSNTYELTQVIQKYAKHFELKLPVDPATKEIDFDMELLYSTSYTARLFLNCLCEFIQRWEDEDEKEEEEVFCMEIATHDNNKENVPALKNKKNKPVKSMQALYQKLNEKVPCSIPNCDNNNHKGFANLFALNRHILQKHTNTRPFPCDECSKKFPTDDSLRRHKVTHRPDTPFVCPVCPDGSRGFKLRDYLVQHCKRAHPLFDSDSIPQTPSVSPLNMLLLDTQRRLKLSHSILKQYISLCDNLDIHVPDHHRSL